ncbi:hypothetical protein O7626_00350 [Micromonospora sp. WMMD1102]|uniref:hypothetical protein n=1 Tax=Micromonospora sp. WMMD1102 TaxID=3016105 RepID=UPI00241549FD|nr:hypothetical protein [Micromonospora sp. WMMD1102]MDG4784396.1 hypothetical protein [Micromonospora sp. WMMD1102]
MPDEYGSLTCILPNCREPLTVRWELYAPLVAGELEPGGTILTPGDALGGGWQVECEAGHVILLPELVRCDVKDAECMAGDCRHGDDLADWRRADVERLAGLLRSAGVLPAAEPDPFDHVLRLTADGGWAVDHPTTCRVIPCAVRVQVEIAAAVGDLPPRSRYGRYRVGVNDLGDRLLIGDRIGGTDG